MVPLWGWCWLWWQKQKKQKQKQEQVKQKQKQQQQQQQHQQNMVRPVPARAYWIHGWIFFFDMRILVRKMGFFSLCEGWGGGDCGRSCVSHQLQFLPVTMLVSFFFFFLLLIS